MIGKEINSDRIEDVAMFLGGECSCQVKDLNHGYDLLMSADWDAILREHALNFSANAVAPSRRRLQNRSLSRQSRLYVAAATLSVPEAGRPCCDGNARRARLSPDFADGRNRWWPGFWSLYLAG